MNEDSLGLEPTADDTVWRLPVTEALTGGRQQLFGGCAVGAAATLVERVSGLPAVWATAQFYGMAHPGQVLELRVTIPARGRSMAQARVQVLRDGRELICALVAAGRKRYPGRVQAVTMPSVPPPDACGPRVDELRTLGGITAQLDVRSADPGRLPWSYVEPHATTRLWMRFEGQRSGDLVSTAVLADLFPPVLAAALADDVDPASLDNTMRWLDRAHEEWLLVDATVESVRGGVAIGASRVWTADGRLLAVASQTCSVAAR